MKVKILAFGAHPDDVELSCSGLLAKHKILGDKIAIVDLTKGELGSRGTIKTRKQEAEIATKILDIDVRENLGFEDGFFENNKKNQLKVIEKIRTYQPDIVLCNATNDRHPDHGKGAQLIVDACFLSGLIKIETTNNGKKQLPWRPKRVFHYIQDLYLEPQFIIDISKVWELKKASILAYSSQFNASKSKSKEPQTYISGDTFIQSIEQRAALLGKRIGVRFGEGFIVSKQSLGFQDLSSIILPEIV